MVVGAGLLLAQTVFALALLSFLGGWVLWPFRTASRPYLPLAAPLAGIASLSVTLTILYYSIGLSVPLSLAAIVPLSGPTVICLIRWRRRGGTVTSWKLASIVLIGVSAWCTVCCNRTSIRCGEPTICLRDGSDALGYAQVASWILQHPHEQASWNPARPHEAYVHVMDGDPRPGAFLLIAAAGYVRGSTPLFSFDWATGVVLAAGVLALAGAFASRPSGLLFLLAAGIASSWFTLSRTGYFGKIVAYPGCILLVFVFFSTWRQFSVKRLLAGTFLALGVGLCHSPATPPAILGLLLGTVAVALIPHWLLGRSVPDFLEGRRLDWRHLGKGLLIFVVLMGPLIVLFGGALIVLAAKPPTLSIENTRLFTFALDVDNPHVPFVAPRLGTWLVCLVLFLNAIGWGVAFRARHIEAASLLLCVVVLAAGWGDHRWGLSQFAGVLFPLSAVGIGLLLEKLQSNQISWIPQAAILTFGLVMVGLRLFQFDESYKRYKIPADSPFCFRQSGIESLAHIVGDKPVDLAVSDLYTGILLMTELGGRGFHIQVREPTWGRTLAYTSWPVPSFPRDGVYVIRDHEVSSNPELVRFHTQQYQLLSNPPASTATLPLGELCEVP